MLIVSYSHNGSRQTANETDSIVDMTVDVNASELLLHEFSQGKVLFKVFKKP